jgi:hypothetical protein
VAIAGSFRVFIAVLRWNGQVVCRAAGSWRRTNGNGHHASLPRDAAGVLAALRTPELRVQKVEAFDIGNEPGELYRHRRRGP